MCFSAGASFGASVVIASIGSLALKKAKTPAQRIFSVIPILFAIQQFTEGLIWLELSNSMGPPPLLSISTKTYVYLVFAWVIWPPFLPYSFFLLETNDKRKYILKIIVLIGIGISTLLCYILISYKVTPKITDHHIQYLLDFNHMLPLWFGLMYLTTTVFSCFISSAKGIWFLGVINLASFIYTKLVFDQYLISMWCYFAALSSIGVLVIIHQLVKHTHDENKSSKNKIVLKKEIGNIYISQEPLPDEDLL